MHFVQAAGSLADCRLQYQEVNQIRILIYMSIRPIISARQQEGRIEQLPHTLYGSRTPRLIYLMKNVFDQIVGPWPDVATAMSMGMLRADLDRFLEGGSIIVGHRRSRHAYMKRLDPGRDEVWEIRSRDPTPELRLFGRFAETDLFVGTACIDRDYLGDDGTPEWRNEMVRCITEWRNLFHPYPPLTQRPLNEYISSNAVNHGFLVRRSSGSRGTGLSSRPRSK